MTHRIFLSKQGKRQRFYEFKLHFAKCPPFQARCFFQKENQPNVINKPIICPDYAKKSFEKED
jgi:hypothetical protein